MLPLAIRVMVRNGMTGAMTTKLLIKYGWILILLFLPSHICAGEGESETYHILQKGFILVEGSTNFFTFTEKSLHHTGKLEENEAGLYSGHVILRFDQIGFQFPAVDSVLKDPGYLDTENYPSIEITLDHFDPHRKPPYLKGILDLHGTQKKIQIQIDLFDISPIVKATGQFDINLDDFRVRPYKSGILEIENRLNISFQLFFCETHTGISDDHLLVDPKLRELLTQENIIILSQPGYFGCAELKKK